MMERRIAATYRLQLRPGFGFTDAAAVVPYLARLGVSHLYLSPVYEAAPGSTHGYDVVDYSRLRAALGGDDAFASLVETAHDHGLGIVLDIVPHHMAATAENAWWWSVLELGQDSPYAQHFDIDWDPPTRRLRGSVLLPVLGDHYGRVLESGELHLERGKEDALVARYYEHVAPLSPDTADEIWAIAGRRGTDVDEVLAEINADRDRVDAILNRQHHRFARWQSANHELDYRRFFDIDSLVALRTERTEVLVDSHAMTLRLVQEGTVDGLRVDHVDGLRDPAAYLEWLRSRAPDAWIVVEKILRPGEALPQWPIDGTTGYDFLALAGALLVDPEGVAELEESYRRFVGVDHDADVCLLARREALVETLDTDLERLTAILVRVCEGRRRWRDFTRRELREALVEIIIRYGSYRSYVRTGTPATDADRRLVDQAIDATAREVPDVDGDLLDLLSLLFTGALTGDVEAEFVARFQQLTGPVAAKGTEDTAFYRWTPLLSLNEVGAEPDHPSVDAGEFHAECSMRQRTWPLTMAATSTHDTKRSEDVRARLMLLSEIPADWSSAAAHWAAMNNRHRDIEADAPDRQDEWFIYQQLVGAHPLGFDRAWTVIEKSLRESKRRTTWMSPDEHYEGVVRRFVEAIMTDVEFLDGLDRFVAPLVDPGRVNSLTLVALRLLAPGVPDTYQGTELWDDSLVDPDNRRPVDFTAHAAMLESIEARSAADLWREDRESGAPKLALVRDCLRVRADHPDAFGVGGSYRPFDVEGADAGHVVAFTRGDEVAVAVPRLVMKSTFGDARVALPPGHWHNVLTGADHGGGSLPFTEVRDDFPVAVLERLGPNFGEKQAP
jgi:(1->4)-alpha-D-glucan 1-alpha-D-glucosylmutase